MDHTKKQLGIHPYKVLPRYWTNGCYGYMFMELQSGEDGNSGFPESDEFSWEEVPHSLHCGNKSAVCFSKERNMFWDVSVRDQHGVNQVPREKIDRMC